MVNLKELKDIITLMNEHGLAEIELEREGVKVRVRKAGSAFEAEGTAIERMERMVASLPAAVSAAPASAAAPEAAKSAGTEIKSPMVGTFYRSPAPDAPPFVEVGQQIEVGQVLCIIEAMKLMNEIKAEMRGRIAAIPIENGQPIEFGQVLFVVEPT